MENYIPHLIVSIFVLFFIKMIKKTNNEHHQYKQGQKTKERIKKYNIFENYYQEYRSNYKDKIDKDKKSTKWNEEYKKAFADSSDNMDTKKCIELLTPELINKEINENDSLFNYPFYRNMRDVGNSMEDIINNNITYQGKSFNNNNEINNSRKSIN